MKPVVIMFLMAMACLSCTTTYYVVRHAERADNSANSPLSPAGAQRALVLRDSLRNRHIDTIFATKYIRTQQTVEPLARAIGKEVHADTGSVENIIAELQQIKNKRVLVAGHSNTVPRIVQGLSGRAVAAIADNDFDNLYVVRIRRGIGTKRMLKQESYGAASGK